jgi:DNA adenine methylase
MVVSRPNGTFPAEQATRAKPFLRWAGSKRKQLDRLAHFWTGEHTRYIEPFVGSACLFFELAPSKAILGDSNESLIEVYRAVRDTPDRLYDRLSRIRRDEETYYRWRKKSSERLDSETRVVRFLYLNRNCFNGIFRTNTRGEFNVPFGVRPGAYFSRADLKLCSSLLGNAEFVAGDFGRTVELVRKGDFVYLDPPFAVKSRRVFRHYGASLFSSDDVPRLAEALGTISRSGADFLVSYADCKEARALTRDWNAVRLPVRRHVAGFSCSRRLAYEWLISNRPMAAGFHRSAKGSKRHGEADAED